MDRSYVLLQCIIDYGYGHNIFWSQNQDQWYHICSTAVFYVCIFFEIQIHITYNV